VNGPIGTSACFFPFLTAPARTSRKQSRYQGYQGQANYPLFVD